MQPRAPWYLKPGRDIWRRPILSLSSFALLFALMVGLPTGGMAGPGDLLVSPVRVVMEGRDRSAELTLVNRSDETATYRITVENRRMREDGSFEEIQQARSDELLAEELVRYAPRRITLQPGTPQTIRLLLRKPRDLAEGEYRSHLMFRAVPDEQAGTTLAQEEEDNDGISIRLIPIYGITIPVIVRHGDLQADVAVTDARLGMATSGSERPVLAVTLERSGARSVYGDITITAASSDASDATVLAQIRGIAVYAPNARRVLEIPLDDAAFARISGQEVDVAFSEVSGQSDRVSAQNRFQM
ncbi:MAG: hypothetical protein AAF530_09515 [Pseudomonadota bacterium]